MEIQVNMIEKLPGRLVLSDYSNDDNDNRTIATTSICTRITACCPDTYYKALYLRNRNLLDALIT
ncbi:MAG: hypothetical protein JO327_08580 [Nitrososphaeraceae archaeon]|nr:hypothetical protein [Nitrososphaeraceae archaeon]MBV9668172.1 hypothetical protein [Nitrososphaeraceae archaeon]